MTPRTNACAALLALVLLAGCSTTQYIISTNNGTLIQANGKPTLNAKTGMYEYRDSEGRNASIAQDQVKQILER